MLRLRRTAAILALLPAIAAANSDLIQVTNIRSWSHASSTRVIVESTGPLEFKANRATGPDRLFFDIQHSEPWIGKHRTAVHDVNDRLVHRVRIAETAPGTTRIVFDLTGPADFDVSRLDSPDRLVIQLRPAPSRALALNHRGFFLPPARAPRIPVIANPPLLTQLQPFTFGLPDPMAFVAVRPPKSAAPPIPSATRVLTGAHPSAGASSPLASENASKSLTRALGLKVNRIVIDAGHGGHDDGTIGPNGTLEKSVVLDIALRLSKLIQEKMGADVVLTRSDDTFIPLHERTAIANHYHADLFLSIHANSSPLPTAAGTESYYLNFTSSPGALDVAARENAGAEKSVGELRDLVQTITLNEKIEESRTFAETVQTAIQAQASRSNPAQHNRGVKKAPFLVLIGAGMPSVLAEIGFLSNAHDEANLGRPEYRQKVADALYRGVSRYAQSLSHFEASRQTARNEKPASGVSQ